MNATKLLLLLVTLRSITSGDPVLGQSPPISLVQKYAGLSITGAVGSVYTVQYTLDPAQSNGWRGAGIVQLPSSLYLWVDKSAPATGQRFYRALAGPTNLAWIPAGTFTMGAPPFELDPRILYQEPQTVVTLTRSFFMGKFEVTQGEYLSVMSNNPSYFKNGATPPEGGSGSAVTNELSHPVDQVLWIDATNYCGQLTDRERLAGRLPDGWAYRLPTEAEWEYACRAGTTSAFTFGQALRSGMANFDGTQEYDLAVGTTNNPDGIFLGQPTAVGSYGANGWGLYDMHGNLQEWCSDWFGGVIGGRVTDPQGPPTGSDRVLRGGQWRDDAWYCRSASRFSSRPDGTHYSVGFRVVLAPNQ